MVDTAKTTSLVFIILLGAAMLTAAFRAFGGEELVREFLTGLPGGFWAQFVVVMAVISVLMGFGIGMYTSMAKLGAAAQAKNTLIETIQAVKGSSRTWPPAPAA